MNSNDNNNDSFEKIVEQTLQCIENQEKLLKNITTSNTLRTGIDTIEYLQSHITIGKSINELMLLENKNIQENTNTSHDLSHIINKYIQINNQLFSLNPFFLRSKKIPSEEILYNESLKFLSSCTSILETAQISNDIQKKLLIQRNFFEALLIHSVILHIHIICLDLQNFSFPSLLHISSSSFSSLQEKNDYSGWNSVPQDSPIMLRENLDDPNSFYKMMIPIYKNTQEKPKDHRFKELITFIKDFDQLIESIQTQDPTLTLTQIQDLTNLLLRYVEIYATNLQENSISHYQKKCLDSSLSFIDFCIAAVLVGSVVHGVWKLYKRFPKVQALFTGFREILIPKD